MRSEISRWAICVIRSHEETEQDMQRSWLTAKAAPGIRTENRTKWCYDWALLPSDSIRLSPIHPRWALKDVQRFSDFSHFFFWRGPQCWYQLEAKSHFMLSCWECLLPMVRHFYSLDNAGVMTRNKHLTMCEMVYAIEKKLLGLFQ